MLCKSLVNPAFELARDPFHRPSMPKHQCRGRPLGKKRKSEHREKQALHSLSPVRPALAKTLQEANSESEDDYGEGEWDLHAGTKPSPLDGEASDEQWDPEDGTEDIDDEACYKNISPEAAWFVGGVRKVTGMPVRLAKGGSSKGGQQDENEIS